ncbi:MAG: hypothetical protein IPJ88_11640 [Myxococcales bacterium]|nr:MAG: hypothetical protein IPJ88_11640 [Myxococcales bacterium]
MNSKNIFIGLVHYPIRDRAGGTVSTAVTNLDIHDLARLARSYGLGGYYLITPISAQRELSARVLKHWLDGPGKSRVPERSEALKTVRVVSNVEQACESIRGETTSDPFLWVTAARKTKAKL